VLAVAACQRQGEPRWHCAAEHRAEHDEMMMEAGKWLCPSLHAFTEDKVSGQCTWAG
jgi:hypothetical protein